MVGKNVYVKNEGFPGFPVVLHKSIGQRLSLARLGILPLLKSKSNVRGLV